MEFGQPWVWKKLPLPEGGPSDLRWIERIKANFISLNARMASLMQLLKEEATVIFESAWDPPSILNNALANLVLTTPGVLLGDRCVPAFSLTLPVGMFLTASATAAGQITVVLDNRSGGTVDLGAGILTIRVWS